MKIKMLTMVTLATSLLVTSAGLATWWTINGRTEATGHPLAATETSEPKSPRLSAAGVAPVPDRQGAESQSDPLQLDRTPQPAVGTNADRTGTRVFRMLRLHRRRSASRALR